MYGKCTRYRVKGIPGIKDRSFDALQDAKTWLAQAQTDARRGEFVDPRDGGHFPQGLHLNALVAYPER